MDLFYKIEIIKQIKKFFKTKVSIYPDISGKIVCFTDKWKRIPNKRIIIFSKNPIEGFECIRIRKASKKAFFKYCKKIGIDEKDWEKFYRKCHGYIENIKYFREKIRKKRVRKMVVISYVFTISKFCFYIIGWFKMGYIAGIIAAIFAVTYFINRRG